MSLLSSSTGGRTSSQTEAVSALAHRIDYTASTLLNAPASGNRLQGLERIVSGAQQLAIDLAQQRANFTFERPTNSMFDPAVMEDVLQVKRSEELKGRKVQSVVFPAVFKFGNNEGTNWGMRTVILKAAVLV